MKNIKAFIKPIIIYSFISLLASLIIPRDPHNAGFFGFSVYRLTLIGVLILLIVFLSSILVSQSNEHIVQKTLNRFIIISSTNKASNILFFLLIHSFLIFGIVFFILWIYFQERSAYFIRLFPFTFLLLAIGIQSLLWVRSNYKIYLEKSLDAFLQLRSIIKTNKAFKFTLYFIVFIFGWLYLYWGINHSLLVNQDPSFSDQHSYLSIAKKAYETNFQYHGDRNRMPIYPYLLALLYKTEMSDSVFFELGKIFNVLLSFTLLLGLFLIFKKSFSTVQAILLASIIAFSLFIYKSGYVQPELLFYFMYFISYLLMLEMLSKPQIKLGIITGIVIAITYMTKASVTPSLFLFLGILFLKQVTKIRTSLNLREKLRIVGSGLFYNLVILFAFLVVLAPYLIENKSLFGKYFYNVNSTFYIWYDNWDGVMSGTLAHGDMVGWPNLPDDEIPTIKKYLKEHSNQQIVNRFTLGFQSQMQNIIDQYSFFNYPLIYSSILVVCLMINISGTLKIIMQNFYQILFFVSIIVTNIVLFAWFSPVTNYLDARFTYGLYIPYIYSIFLSIRSSFQEHSWDDKVTSSFQGRLQYFIFEITNLAVFGMLIFEISNQIPNEMVFGWFGK